MKTELQTIPQDQLFTIIPLCELRDTKDVQFHSIPLLADLQGIDRVEHGADAHSPGAIEGTETPWYMHPHQRDHLAVLRGTRIVELYNEKFGGGEVVTIETTPYEIKKNGIVISEGPALLCWPEFVFHRVSSGPEGSMSLNFATRSEAFDIKTNFNIYELNTENNNFKVIREGFKDQHPGASVASAI